MAQPGRKFKASESSTLLSAELNAGLEQWMVITYKQQDYEVNLNGNLKTAAGV